MKIAGNDHIALSTNTM